MNIPANHISNTIYHVMIRGNNRQHIFFSKMDFERFLKIIEESAKKFDHKILAYCLMTNHIHLIVHINNSPLSVIMQKINYRYARWLNKKLDRIGHLFQGRYKSLEVSDDDYLLNLCRYIHLNPVAANIVQFPKDYEWSSHQYYISQNPPEWMDLKFMMETIKKKTNLDYLDFMIDVPEREKWKPSLYLSETGKIIIDNKVAKLREDSGQVKNRLLTQNVIEYIVCNHLKINPIDLYGKTRNRMLSKKRALFFYYLMQHAGMSLLEIGMLTRRTSGTLSRQVERFIQSADEDFLGVISAINFDIAKEKQQLSVRQ